MWFLKVAKSSLTTIKNSIEQLLRGFSTHFSSSARQDLHFEGQLDGFIPSRLDFEGPNFTRKIDILKL